MSKNHINPFWRNKWRKYIKCHSYRYPVFIFLSLLYAMNNQLTVVISIWLDICYKYIRFACQNIMYFETFVVWNVKNYEFNVLVWFLCQISFIFKGAKNKSIADWIGIIIFRLHAVQSHQKVSLNIFFFVWQLIPYFNRKPTGTSIRWIFIYFRYVFLLFLHKFAI